VPRAGTINAPHLAVTATSVYVSDPEEASVIRFDLAGHEQARLGGEFIRPVGLAVDAAGALYVTDAEAHALLKYTTW
jgi:sugar lactone lactonase YvrE